MRAWSRSRAKRAWGQAGWIRTGCGGRLDRGIHVLAYAAVALEVAVDVLVCFGARDVKDLRQAEVALPEHQPEVDGLRDPPLFAADRLLGDAEHLSCGSPVNVDPRAKGIQEGRIWRKVRKHAQLDLGVVRRQHLEAWIGDEGVADLLADLRANGNVLEIGAARRNATGGRDSLVEARVQAARARVDQR